MKKNESDPISSVIVIDKSGSMDAEGKMAFAIKGADSLVDLLTEHDTIGVVVFDGVARSLFDINYATSKNKDILHKLISDIYSSGMTNMYDGLKMGIDMLLAPRKPSEKEKEMKPRIKRLVLLSDGLPQVKTGLSELVAAAHMEGITISSVGLGLDYDEELMQEIAEKGGGNYYYVRESQNLPNVFVAELGFGRRTVTHHTQAYFAYDSRAVQAVEIVGCRTAVVSADDVQRVRKLQREKKAREAQEEREEKELERDIERYPKVETAIAKESVSRSGISEGGGKSESGESSGSKGGNGSWRGWENGNTSTNTTKRKWEVIPDQDVVVLSVDMRDFTADEERDILIYMNYTTMALNGTKTGIEIGTNTGTSTAIVQPYVYPLASLVVVYMMEDPTNMEGKSENPEEDEDQEGRRELLKTVGGKQKRPRQVTPLVYTTQGISTLQLDVTVDDDTHRAAAVNGAAGEIEAQRRVGRAVEFDDANRVHVRAMDMMNQGRFDEAEAMVSAKYIHLKKRLTEMAEDDDEDTEGDDEDTEGAYMLEKQAERFEKSQKMMKSGRKDSSVRSRMSKASKHFSFASSLSLGASMSSSSSAANYQMAGNSRENDGIEL